MIWGVVSDALSPIRMPLFFLISGFLSEKFLHRPLRDNFQRTFGMLLLSVLWTGIFLLRLLLPAARDGFAPPSAQNVIAALLLPTSFWYIWALPAAHLCAWTLWQPFGQRSRLIILPLVVISFFGPAIERHTIGLIPEPLDALKAGSIALNAMWYFVGLHFKTSWATLIQRASIRRLWFSGLTYVIAVAIALYTSAEAIMTAHTPLAVIGLVFAANGFGLMRFSSPFARLMTWIGRRTLPVYVLHLFGVAGLSGAIKLSGLDAPISANALIIDLIASPVVCLLLVISTRNAGDVLERIGLKAIIHPIALRPTDDAHESRNAAWKSSR